MTARPGDAPGLQPPAAAGAAADTGATPINPQQGARPEDPCGEPPIPCPLGAPRTPPPRVRLGPRRTPSWGRGTPSPALPPGAAPASGRATAPRSDAPGGC